MDYISLGICVFTACAVIFGVLLGWLRGWNRALTRFILVVLSVVGAIFLSRFLTQKVFGIKLSSGETVLEFLINKIPLEEKPQALVDLIVGVIEIFVDLILYFIVFYVLKFLSWAIIFPISKIFIKKKKGLTSALVGIAIGFLQGILISFVVCAPINGLANQLYRVSKITYEGETIEEKLEDTISLDVLNDYKDSTVNKIYTGIGEWYFDLLSVYEDSSGKQYKLGNVISVAETSLALVGNVTDISNSLNEITDSETGEVKTDALRDVASSLKEMDSSINGLDEQSKELFQGVLSDLVGMVSGSGSGSESGGETGGEIGGETGGETGGAVGGESTETPSEIATVLDKIDFEKMDLESAGGSLEGIADYIDSKEKEDAEFTEESAEKIVEGFAKNEFIIDIIEESEVDLSGMLDSSDEEKFQNAINKSELSDENKDKLMAMLGLNK